MSASRTRRAPCGRHRRHHDAIDARRHGRRPLRAAIRVAGVPGPPCAPRALPRGGAHRALGETPRIDAACFGVAGPVAHDRVQVTNLPWEIEGRALAAAFGIGRVALVNDFVANAHGIAVLGPADLATLQPGEPVEDAPRLLIGAGTGLGVCLVVRGAGGDGVVPSEGGHVAFAPTAPPRAITRSPPSPVAGFTSPAASRRESCRDSPPAASSLHSTTRVPSRCSHARFRCTSC